MPQSLIGQINQWQQSNLEIFPPSSIYNVLVGTNLNTSGYKFLVNGNAKFQGDVEITGDLSATIDTIKVVNKTDNTNYQLNFCSSDGNQIQILTNPNITFNPSTGVLVAQKMNGDLTNSTGYQSSNLVGLIQNNQLQNSSITLGSTSINLGDTSNTIRNLTNFSVNTTSTEYNCHINSVLAIGESIQYGEVLQQFNSASTNYFSIGFSTGSLVSDNEEKALNITRNGNIGIGKTTINYKLDVDGTINASLYLLNGNAITTDNILEGNTNLYYTDGRFDTRFSAKNTNDLSEGTSNLYYTDGRFDTRFSAKNTNDLSEGTDNLYYTDGRFDTRFSAKTTNNLSEGTDNLYYTDARFDTRFSAKNTNDLLEGTLNKYSQWSETNNDLSYTAGNVGIGTSTPKSKLHILQNQNTLILEGTDRSYIEFYPKGYSNNRRGYIGYYLQDSNLYISNENNNDIHFLTNNNSTQMIIKNNGNIGIGTSTINYKLDVNGVINSTGYLLNGNTITTDNIDEGNTNLYSQWSELNNNISYSSGNVGIGTTIPNSVLEIIGDIDLTPDSASIRFGKNSSDNYIQQFTSSTGFNTINFKKVNTTLLNRILSYNHTNSGSGFLDLSSQSTSIRIKNNSYIDITGNLNLNSGYKFYINNSQIDTYDVLEGSNLYYTDARFDTRFNSKTTDNLTEGPTKKYSQWTTTSTNKIAFNGSVSINQSSNPNYELEVNGTIKAGIAGDSSANKPALLVSATGLYSQRASIAIQQATTEGDTIIFADYEPYVEWGMSASNSNNSIDFTAGSTTNNLGSKIFYNNSGNSRTAYIKARMHLDSGNFAVGGKCAIGQSVPTYRLDVNGDINTSTIYRVNGNQINTDNVLESSTKKYSQFTTHSSTEIYTASSVRIGGIGPAIKALDVDGDASIDGDVNISGQYKINGMLANPWVVTASTGTDILNIAFNGGVGINQTSNPVHKLEVSGDCFFVHTSLTTDAVKIKSPYLQLKLQTDRSSNSYLQWGASGTNGADWDLQYAPTGGAIQRLWLLYLNEQYFYTNGGILCLKFNNNGNVGVGTSSPTTKFEVATSNSSGDMFRLTRSTNNQFLAMGHNSGAYLFALDYEALRFGTNNIERMRIDRDGNLGLNSITPQRLFHCQGYAGFFGSSDTVERITINPQAGSGQIKVVHDYTSGVVKLMDFYTRTSGVNTNRGYIFWNGYNLQYWNTSDYRLKEDYKPIEDHFEVLEKLNPINYKMRENELRTNGFIAHELQEAYPNAAYGEKDAVDEDGNPIYQAICTNELIPIMVKCLKEIKKEKDELKTKCNDLEIKYNDLEIKYNDLDVKYQTLETKYETIINRLVSLENLNK